MVDRVLLETTMPPVFGKGCDLDKQEPAPNLKRELAFLFCVLVSWRGGGEQANEGKRAGDAFVFGFNEE
jgi:hypothetical protein